MLKAYHYPHTFWLHCIYLFIWLHYVCASYTLQECTVSISLCTGTYSGMFVNILRDGASRIVSHKPVGEKEFHCMNQKHNHSYKLQVKSLHLQTQTPVVENCVASVWRSSWTAPVPHWPMPSQAGGLSVRALVQTDTGSRVLLRALEKLFCSRLER